MAARPEPRPPTSRTDSKFQQVQGNGPGSVMIKLSDYVMQFVARLGVKHVFMLPGGGAMHLNDSLGRCRGLEYVCNLHEQASAIAAENYARLSENIGVALVTTGPG